MKLEKQEEKDYWWGCQIMVALRSTIGMSTVLILVGCSFLVLAHVNLGTPNWILSLLSNFGGLILATGVLSVIWEYIGKRELASEFVRQLEVTKNASKAGLVNFYPSWRDVDLQSYIYNSSKITVFVGYSDKWLSYDRSNLANHLADGCELEVLLPNVSNVELMEKLSAKFGQDIEKLRKKVKQHRDFICEIAELGQERFEYRKGIRGAERPKRRVEDKVKCKVYWVDEVPSQPMYIFDKNVLISLYLHKNATLVAPTLEFAHGPLSESFIEHLVSLKERTRNSKIANGEQEETVKESAIWEIPRQIPWESLKEAE